MLQQAKEADWERVRNVPRLARSKGHAAQGIGKRRIQLIVSPSFENPSVWEVRQGDHWQLIRPRVVETSPELMIVGHDVVPFKSSELSRYFERFAAITIPLRPDLSSRLGTDGTLYELALFGDMYSQWRFQWWFVSPDQWQPLAALTVEMHAAFSAVPRPSP